MLRPDTFVVENPSAVPMLETVEGVRVRTDIAFTNKSGQRKNAIRSAAEALLKKLGPTLQRFLGPDEFVVYLVSACAPMSALEQYTFGYFAQFVSRAVLVFTSERLLVFRTDRDGTWRQNWRACSLGDITTAKASGWISGQIKLTYAGGKKETYWAMKQRDKAKLKALLPKLLEASAGGQTQPQGMAPRCPACAAILTDRQYACTACGQKFRDEKPLWWRSLIPGGAYFYARQSGLGLLHAVVDSLFTLELLIIWITAVTAKPAERTADFWVGMAWITFIVLLERSIALWHARRFVREFIPVTGNAAAAQSNAAAMGSPMGH